MRKREIFGLLLLLLLGLIDLWPRYKMENNNKSVGLCLEMPVVRETSLSTRRSLLNTFQELKKAGLKYVVLPEETLGDLLLQGNVQILDGKKISAGLPLLQRIQESLKIRYEINLPIQNGTLDLKKNEIEFKSLKNLALGIFPKDALLIKQCGLIGIARHSNFYGSYSKSIKETLNRSKKLGIDYYLPENDQLLGFKSNLDVLASSLKDLNMFYVSAEFAKMQGDTALGTKIPERTIRLHSAQIAELEKMDPASIMERYVRAYKERNIRLLLIRPYTNSTNHPLSTICTLLSGIKSKIEKSGGKIGEIKPFQPLAHRLNLNILFLLSILFLVRASSKKMIVGTAVCLLLGLKHLYSGALLAFVAPFCGYWLIKTNPSQSVLWKYGIWSLTSITAGVRIAGIGSNLATMLHFIPFPGVKMVQVLPILGIGVWALKDASSIKKIWESPVQWKGAVLSFLGVGVLTFMLVRSGNDSPATVSGFEIKLRSVWDTLFYVRPRTKEFLIGHPALWIGLSLVTLKNVKDRFSLLKNYASIIGVVMGTIGQVSIINTFCHFHTPLEVTLTRVLIGLILGAFIGQIGVFGVRYLSKRYA